MLRTKMRFALPVAAAILMLGASVALCDVVENMAVSATVLSVCTFGAAPALAFGTYDPTSGTDKAGTATVTLTCTLGTPVLVSLDNGTHFASSTRNLSDGTNSLQYGIYQNSGHTTPWGTGANSEAYVGTGIAGTITAFGLIPKSQQSAANGSYTDTVVVTVTL